MFSRALKRPVMQRELMMAQKRKSRGAPCLVDFFLPCSRESSLDAGGISMVCSGDAALVVGLGADLVASLPASAIDLVSMVLN